MLPIVAVAGVSAGLQRQPYALVDIRHVMVSGAIWLGSYVT